jgi:hypothetical protein
MAASDLTAKTTHDLWIEARQFTLAISRPTPTTIALTVTYPTVLETVDGAVITINDKAVSSVNYPDDGTQYTASTDLAVPASRIEGLDGAHVVGFYSGILNSPLPGVADLNTGKSSFTVTITNTVANTLYYASVHACTNVLQYYPIGIQSYPLEASRVEKDSSSYTGNIPSLPEAPTSPSPGFVYHDKGMNLVQYWNGSQWIPTRADAILSGPYNPGTLGQVYFYTALNQLKVFNGTTWITCDATNLSFMAPGPTWIPLGKVAGVIKVPETPAVGDFIWNFSLQRAQYWDGSSWVYPTSANSLYNKPPLTPAFTTAIYAESVPLAAPYLGQLFYNTSTRVLNVFNGSTWIQANTDQQGTPSSDKIAIGTDGSYDERLRLIKVLKTQLGWPVQCVELKEEQFNVAIDNALDNYRQLSDAAYTMKYVMYTVMEGQQLYYLNSATDGTDRIVAVNKIHRLNILGANSLNWDSNIYFQTFLNQYYSSGYTDILSIHMMHSLSEDFQRIFAGDLTFLWDEPSRELMITRRIARSEKVILECYMERTEQELLLDRYCKQYMQNWALAECKMQLGLIRSKFSSGTPGANGPINLNGEMLIAEARQDMTELKEELLNYEYGGLVGKGNVSFLMG